MMTTKLFGALAVATLLGSFGCSSSVPQPVQVPERSLADVSPELLHAAMQPTDSYEVEWEDTQPEQVKKAPTAHTRAARSQLFTRSRKNQIFVAPSNDSPTGFTSTN